MGKRQDNVTSNASQYCSIQVRQDLIDNFTKFCESCGLNVSSAVSMLAMKTIDEGQVPFRVEPLEMFSQQPADGKTRRLSIRMDREMQDKFCNVCDKIGLTRSALIRMFMMRCLNDKRFPF